MLKEFRNFVKEGLFWLIANWHRETAPKHFKNKAIQTYNYKPRSPGYQKYKERKHLGPLVFSGKSRQQLLQSIRVSGTSKKAAGAMQAPRYFWMNPPGHPRKSEELVAVTQEEVKDMAEALNEEVTKKLNAVKDKEVIR